MMLWLRARHVWWAVIALAVILVLDALIGQLALSVPALFGGGADFVFVRTYLPLIWAAWIADSFAARRMSAEWRPTPIGHSVASRLALCDLALFVGATALVAVAFAGFSGIGWTGWGPVLVMAGVACVGAVGGGAAVGSFASTMLMLATSVYPRTAPGARFVHVLQPDGEPIWSLFCGVAACLVATVMLFTNAAHANAKATQGAEA